MGDIKLSSSGGGSVTLTPPSTASNLTLTLPAATSTLLDTTSTQTLTNKTLVASGSNTVEATSGPTSTQLAGNRNKIINGAMMIDQRNAGASVTNINGATYVVDRFSIWGNVASKFTAQQNAGSVTPPAGFTNYLGITSSSAYSIGSSDYFLVSQNIEGFNSADLSWGTANAKSVTLSFQVYSSLTGTFGGSLENSATTRSYPFQYTISSANTWTSISVTIAGDQSGTWVGATNGIGMRVWLGLGVGSTLSNTAGAWATGDYRSATGATSVVGTNGATFYITGVQLEKGATATPFENRLYGTELALCQRYFQVTPSTLVSGAQSQTSYCNWFFPVTMRAAPTFTAGSGTGISGSTPYPERLYFYLTGNYAYLGAGSTVSAEL